MVSKTKLSFKNKKILITGGTGSLGRSLAERLLKLDVDVIRIFSRNENKQVMMASELSDNRLRYFIGDVRDYPRLKQAMEDVDIVFHAAALKHVPVIEYNPYEAVKTNVIGSQNVIQSSIKNDVEIAVGIGTDKAVSPLNAYGATKQLMEKLFVTANNYLNKKNHRTKFIALRYGNVLGSSGSVVPKFISQLKNKQKITITDENMTRFSITMDEALDFILDSTLHSNPSEIHVPKLKAYSIIELKDALAELIDDYGFEKIPIRPGEKIHEILINSPEMKSTWENTKKYVIFSPYIDKKDLSHNTKNLKKVHSQTQYSSDKVPKLSKDNLKKLIVKSNLL